MVQTNMDSGYSDRIKLHIGKLPSPILNLYAVNHVIKKKTKREKISMFESKIN